MTCQLPIFGKANNVAMLMLYGMNGVIRIAPKAFETYFLSIDSSIFYCILHFFKRINSFRYTFPNE